MTIEAIISDLDGVVYRGDRPIPGAVEAINEWARRGIGYAFVTNNATLSPAAFARKLNGMGVDVEPDRVVTSVEAAAAYLAKTSPASTRTFVIGEKALFDAVGRAGAEIVDGEDVEAVVLGFDYLLDYAKLRTAVRAVMNGAALIVTNPDVITPADTGYEPCVGAILAAIVAAVPQARPVVAGKPSPLMIEEALRRLGTVREHTIMVGDQIQTDIVAGQAAGLRSFLVTTGVPSIGEAAAVPDAVIAGLGDIRIRAAEAVFGEG